MFKKAFKISSKNNLSGKDRKKLISDLSKYYDPQSVSLLLDQPGSNIVTQKVSGTKTILYFQNDLPIIADLSGKGDIIPTIYAIHQCPNICKFLEIKVGVESFLMGGANLMWPGVKNLAGLGPFNKDDVRYVKNSENQVIAVGIMACSSAELAAQGPKGEALFTFHVIEDKLWGIGPKKVLSPLVEEAGKKEESTQEAKEEGENEEEEKVEEEEKKEEEVERIKEDEDEEPADDGDKEDTIEESKEGEPTVSPKEMEEYLMEAFLTALKVSLQDKDLPLDGGDFFSNHLLPCKREGVFIDIKNTSYKKTSKFLQAMSKLGFIDFKEQKKGSGAYQITKVNRKNKQLMDFVPVVEKAAKKEVKEEISDDDKWPKVEIQELYKLKTPMFHFFPDDTYVKDKDTLFPIEHIRSTMQKYLTDRNLVDKRNIKLNDQLKALFKDEKFETGVPDVMLREDFFKRIENYLTLYHRIYDTQTQEEDIKHGNPKGITLVAEKSHNKNITRISGLETFKFNIPSLVNKFQLKYACSVSTQTFKEKTSEKTEVTVHGNFIEEISQYFIEECKINKKYIHGTNKLGKKKKDKSAQVIRQ